MKPKYIICENKAERDAVLAKLESEGYVWGNREPLTKWNMDDTWASGSIALHLNAYRQVTWSFTRSEHRQRNDAVSAQNYLGKHKPILITRKGRVVTAEDKNTGKKAIATCSPTDTFDFGTGAMIAVARLIAQSDKGITKDAETVLRQLLGYDAESPVDIPTEEEPTAKFKVGDLVTLKDGLESGEVYDGITLLSNMYRNGNCKPLKVVEIDSNGHYCCAPTDKSIDVVVSYWYSEEMLEAWDENKIHEGDIVRVINTGLNYSSYPQWVGKHISDPDMAARYCYSSPYTTNKYKVIKIAEHEFNGRMLAFIEECDGIGHNRCYLIEVKGLEKVTE